MPLEHAISMVLERHPDLKLEGLDDRILQWCVCLLEAWFAADADEISLKNWDQEHVLTGGHGLMVDGYYPVIQSKENCTPAQGSDGRNIFRCTLFGCLMCSSYEIRLLLPCLSVKCLLP